jgi:hypothetical protein
MESRSKKIQAGICHERNEQGKDIDKKKREKCYERKINSHVA